MGPRRNHDLLHEVMAETTSSEFRETILRETMRRAQRRRFIRRTRPVAAGIAVLVLVFAATWMMRSPEESARSRPYALVRTEPSAALSNVETVRFVNAVAPPVGSIVVVSTPARGAQFTAIGDLELLALAPHPAALVRTGAHSQQLVLPPSASSASSSAN